MPILSQIANISIYDGIRVKKKKIEDLIRDLWAYVAFVAMAALCRAIS
jgi:hypothetical protein